MPSMNELWSLIRTAPRSLFVQEGVVVAGCCFRKRGDVCGPHVYFWPIRQVLSWRQPNTQSRLRKLQIG